MCRKPLFETAELVNACQWVEQSGNKAAESCPCQAEKSRACPILRGRSHGHGGLDFALKLPCIPLPRMSRTVFSVYERETRKSTYLLLLPSSHLTRQCIRPLTCTLASSFTARDGWLLRHADSQCFMFQLGGYGAGSDTWIASEAWTSPARLWCRDGMLPFSQLILYHLICSSLYPYSLWSLMLHNDHSMYPGCSRIRSTNVVRHLAIIITIAAPCLLLAANRHYASFTESINCLFRWSFIQILAQVNVFESSFFTVPPFLRSTASDRNTFVPFRFL